MGEKLYYFDELCNYTKEQYKNIFNLRVIFKNKWDDIIPKKNKIFLRHFIDFFHYFSDKSYFNEKNTLEYYIELNNKTFIKQITEHLKNDANFINLRNISIPTDLINRYDDIINI